MARPEDCNSLSLNDNGGTMHQIPPRLEAAADLRLVGGLETFLGRKDADRQMERALREKYR